MASPTVQNRTMTRAEALLEEARREQQLLTKKLEALHGSPGPSSPSRSSPLVGSPLASSSPTGYPRPTSPRPSQGLVQTGLLDETIKDAHAFLGTTPKPPTSEEGAAGGAIGQAQPQASLDAGQRDRRVVAQLRNKVAELDSVLQERDSTIESLSVLLSELQSQVDRSSLDPRHNMLWQDRYESMRKCEDAMGEEVKKMNLKQGIRSKELTLLNTYTQKLQRERDDRNGQREQGYKDFEDASGRLQVTKAAQTRLEREIRAHIQGTVLCIGRTTKALAAGNVGLSILKRSDAVGSAEVPQSYFASLRVEEGVGGILEAFSDPMAEEETLSLLLVPGVSVQLTPKHLMLAAKGAPLVEANEEDEGKEEGEKDDDEEVVKDPRADFKLYTSSVQDFQKWAGAFCMLGLLREDQLSNAFGVAASQGSVAFRACVACGSKLDS